MLHQTSLHMNLCAYVQVFLWAKCLEMELQAWNVIILTECIIVNRDRGTERQGLCLGQEFGRVSSVKEAHRTLSGTVGVIRGENTGP